jgi:general transcription factor 3C polypeptide 3 (transcription factor C subunit 4)
LDRSEQSKILEYPDLYLEVANRLLETGLYQNALAFYQPLKRIPEQVTAPLYLQMGRCFQGNGVDFKAEECFQTAIQIDENNIEARMELAKMYEELGEQEQAFIYVNEAMSIKRSQDQRILPASKPRRKRSRIDGPPSSSNAQDSVTPTRGPRTYKPRRLADPVEKLKEETARAEQLRSQYYAMRKEHQGMRNGDARSTNSWMEAARDLTDDFRSFKTFYPWDKYVRFLGYTGDARLQAETSLDSDLTAMAERLSRSLFHLLPLLYVRLLTSVDLGADVADKTHGPSPEIPADYRGIPFSAWLDIFLEYALCLARIGKMQESYEICEAAKDAIVFYHSREDMFLINVAWCGKPSFYLCLDGG